MARITFLGSGGGRFAILTQARASGGIVVEMDREMIHMDPGPGALVRAREFKIKLYKLTGILCSHAHPDHDTDLRVVLEAMTGGAKKKRGVVLAGKNVIDSEGEYRSTLSSYHMRQPKEVKALKPGESDSIGRVRVTATPTRHEEPLGIGFVLQGSERIGYTSDTEYFPGLERHFQDCDVLIMNVLRPRDVEWPGHMNTSQAEKFLKAMKKKPGLVIMHGLGMKMLKANPFKEAAWLEKRTGIRVIAARDGQVIETRGFNLKKFMG